MSRTRDLGKIISGNFDVPASSLDNVTRSNISDLGTGALSNRNMIINGAMQVAQRGTSVTAAGGGAYSSPDRFRFQTNANGNSVISQDTDTPSGFNNSFKLTVGTGSTPSGSDFGRLYYRVEGYDADQLQLGSASSSAVTLSFWVKASVAGTYGIQFAGDGLGGFIASYAVSATGTWEYKTVTIPAGVWTTYNGSTTNLTGFQVAFDLGEGPSRSNVTGYNAAISSGHMGLTGGTKILATSGATWQITGVQLEVGDTATPFEHRSYGDELARCQRYFWAQVPKGEANGAGGNAGQYIIGDGGFLGTGQVECHVQYPVQMRASPTLQPSSGTNHFLLEASSGIDYFSNLVAFAQKKQSSLLYNSGATSGTAGEYTRVAASSVNSYVYWDAEL
mgnify:FL=1